MARLVRLFLCACFASGRTSGCQRGSALAGTAGLILLDFTRAS